MKKRVKIKFNNGDVSVVIPYKNGEVRWQSRWLTPRTFRWVLVDRQPFHNPSRVGRCHQQFLSGRRLQNQILRSAAAAHLWDTRTAFKTAFEWCGQRIQHEIKPPSNAQKMAELSSRIQDE